ncbi:MAG: HEAT repeat domain-containing protein [Limnochordaceae bacterium]|nr:HEAT repeat domain-containing protein [Limnochordaceae bacterium]
MRTPLPPPTAATRRLAALSTRVNYQLLARRKVADALEQLASGRLGAAAERRLQERLLRWHRHLLPVCLEKLRTGSPELISVISRLLLQLEEPVPWEVWEDLLTDPQVRDETKLALIPVLDVYGIDPHEIPWAEILADPLTSARQAFERVLEIAGQSEEVMQQLLDELERATATTQAAYATQLGGVTRPRAVALGLLAALARSPEKEVAQAAVASLAKLGGPAAASILAELATGRSAPTVRSSPVLRYEDAVVTPPDGAGFQAIWLAYRDPAAGDGGPFRALFFLLQSETGVRRVFGLRALSPRGWRRLVAGLAAYGRVLVHASEFFAVRLVQDALWTAQRAGPFWPLSYQYWRQQVGLEEWPPRPYAPALSSGERRWGRRGAGGRLARLPEYEDWFSVDPAVYDLADALATGRLSWSRAEALVVQRVLVPQFNEWKHRLARLADFYRQAGWIRARQEAVWAWLHWRSDALGRHPLARWMARRSLQAALLNMDSGYDPRLVPELFAAGFDP